MELRQWELPHNLETGRKLHLLNLELENPQEKCEVGHPQKTRRWFIIIIIKTIPSCLSIRCHTNKSSPAYQSWASQLVSFQVLPASFISFSTIVLEPSGLPCFLFPGDAHLSGICGYLVLFICRTWPSHLEHFCFTSSSMLLMPVCLLTAALVLARSSFWILRICQRWHAFKPLSWLLTFGMVPQVSRVQRRTKQILEWKIL